MGYVRTNNNKPIVFVKATQQISDKFISESNTETCKSTCSEYSFDKPNFEPKRSEYSQEFVKTPEAVHSSFQNYPFIPSQEGKSEISDDSCMCVEILKLVQHHLQKKKKNSVNGSAFNRNSDERSFKRNNRIKISSERVPKHAWVPKTL